MFIYYNYKYNKMELLNLQSVSYSDMYKLNQGSVSQLMRGLQEMVNRLTEPTNDYQRELYPALRNLVEKLTSRYETLLSTSTSDVDRQVRNYNLHGYNGKIKRSVATKNVKFNLIYKYANFGDYLKTLTQRLNYLLERELPQRYLDNQEEGTSYNKLKTELQELLRFMKDDVESSWNTVVTSARTAGGDNVQENLRKRTSFKPRSQNNKKAYTKTH